jgi:hypothetical protein
MARALASQSGLPSILVDGYALNFTIAAQQVGSFHHIISQILNPKF